jgi:hypothetical protein
MVVNLTVFSNRGSLPLPGYDHQGRWVVLIRPASHDPDKIKVQHFKKK